MFNEQQSKRAAVSNMGDHTPARNRVKRNSEIKTKISIDTGLLDTSCTLLRKKEDGQNTKYLLLLFEQKSCRYSS